MVQGYFSKNSITLGAYGALLFVFLMLWIVMVGAIRFFGTTEIFEQIKFWSAIIFSLLLIWVLIDFCIIPIYLARKNKN